MTGTVHPIDAADPDPLKGGDVYRWAMEQAALIRERRFDEIDILNVADDIEDVGRSDDRALESRIESVLLHILKWDYQPERRSRSWSNPIFENRLQIERPLKESPQLATEPRACGERRLCRCKTLGIARNRAADAELRRGMPLRIGGHSGNILRVRRALI